MGFFSTVPGCSWLYLAVPGCTWLCLGLPLTGLSAFVMIIKGLLEPWEMTKYLCRVSRKRIKTKSLDYGKCLETEEKTTISIEYRNCPETGKINILLYQIQWGFTFSCYQTLSVFRGFCHFAVDTFGLMLDQVPSGQSSAGAKQGMRSLLLCKCFLLGCG